MNQAERINQEFQKKYDAMKHADIISPTMLARQVFELFASGDEEVHIKYTSLSHLKQMAREFLRRRKDADGPLNDAHGAHGEFDFGEEFAGHLQDRYPTPNGEGYKRRELLTPFERAWNVAKLRKSADARNAHADALEAEGQKQEEE
jgi:hypothetical protein